MKLSSLLPILANRSFGWAAIAMVAATCDAQPNQSAQLTQSPLGNISSQGTQTPPSGPNDYVIADAGPDSVVWQNSTGQRLTTLATGMNYWSGQQWNSSDPSFVVSADGTSFVASKVQAPTTLSAYLNSQGAVTVSTPDGVALSSTPTAIGLYDAASGQSVIVASLTNSIGVLADAQHVVYTNAFVGGGFAASVVYSMPDAGSFHQDVIFTGFNPNFDPTVWGFAATSTNTLQIQIFTEFYNPPQPQVRERALYIEEDPNVRASMASPDFIDYSLDFGHYVFGPGRACPSSSYNILTPGVSTAKDFVTANGRTFLVESIKYKDLVTQLQALPPVTVRTSSLKRLPGARRMKVAATSVPQLQASTAHKSEKIPKAVAMVAAKPKGVDVDYFVTLSSLTQPTLYTSDTTYFVTNNVYLSSPVTMESAVFKFPTNTGAIFIQDTLTLATTNYRPAIFTGADDNTAGSPLGSNIWSGYTGVLGTKLYGGAALFFNTTSNITLNNLRFINQTLAINGVAETAGWSLNVSHSQFVGGLEGIAFSSGGGGDSVVFNANNCLFAAVQYPFLAASVGLAGNVCNCTIDQTSSLTFMNSMSGATLNFTNSILTGVGYGLTNGVTLGGSYNGFAGTTPFGTPATSIYTTPYTWTWAGFYYLITNTPFLTNATTNINPALLSQLQMKTTQTPQTLNSPHFTTNTTLWPVVQRDTTGLALGFHYDSLDYIGACGISNYTLTLAPGVAIAYCNNCLTWLEDGSRLISQGTPNQRNYIVYYNAVQEQPLCYYPVTNFMAQLLPFVPLPVGGSALPSIDLRLTTICAPTGEASLWFSGDYGVANVITGLTLQDCEVYGSGANWEMNESANAPNVGFTNNVFYRVPFAINSNAKISSFNNLFYGTTNANEFTNVIVHRSGSPSPNTNENNVFDGVMATLDGVVGYNAYVNGATNTSFTNNHDIITNFAWQGGPLGSYYQPTGSAFLTNGSTFATHLGLYHYTVLTNETVEGTNIVSRGYHYVALTNTTGLPLDYNNDGVPDYLEDTNGDGIDNDARPWNSNTSPWFVVSPVNQYVAAGGSATFSVVAYGTAPLTYLWYTNYSADSGGTSNTYTVSTVNTNNVGFYDVVVTNSMGGSDPFAYLTIVYPPQILSVSPATNYPYWLQTNFEKLSTVVTNPAYTGPNGNPIFGNPPPTYYQWQFNGTNTPSASGEATAATINPAQAPTFDGGTNAVVITNAGGSTTVAWTNVFLAAPGMVEAWGSDASGECNRPISLTNAAGIAAGEFQSVAVTDAGAVIQWGQYLSTNGTSYYSVTDSLHATQPPTNGVIAVAAGRGHALALTSSNTVIAWGLTNSPAATIPGGVPTNNVTAIACGYQFNVELLSNGTVVAWGDDSVGQTNVPANLTNVIGIAAGVYHSMALLSNGTVVSWGYKEIGLVSQQPSSLTNVVAMAAGASHDLALRADGTLVAWGDNDYNETNLPTTVTQSNVMAVAAGDNFNVALLNNGTIVEWGQNNNGQTNVPQFNTNYPLTVKLLAACGNHTMAGIWSPLVQYPINVANDLLLVYNSNSVDSTTVFQYYLAHRPMVSNANVLRIVCDATNETFYPWEFASNLVSPITNWLALNPTKRPQYVVLFPDIPSRVNYGGPGSEGGDKLPCVQYQLHNGCSPDWFPFVTAINMNGTGGVNDCIAYINKLAYFGSNYSPGKLIISASASGYGNKNYYFDDTRSSGFPQSPPPGSNAVMGVAAANSAASITYTNVASDAGLISHITNGSNIAGYLCWGLHSSLGTNYENEVAWSSTNNGWWIIRTAESFNGLEINHQGIFLEWFASTAFGGTAYTNTPVGAVSYVEEPTEFGTFDSKYFGLWESGKTFSICAWNSQNTNIGITNFYTQAVGDPLVSK